MTTAFASAQMDIIYVFAWRLQIFAILWDFSHLSLRLSRLSSWQIGAGKQWPQSKVSRPRANALTGLEYFSLVPGFHRNIIKETSFYSDTHKHGRIQIHF
jgi:hypothetical protein